MKEKFKMTFKEFVQFMASDKVRRNMTLTEVILFRMVFANIYVLPYTEEEKEKLWQEQYKKDAMQDLVIPIKKRLELKSNG